MNIETMKSVILVILIALSLLLSVALWNYQPSSEVVEEGEEVIDTTELDGEENDLVSLVEPEQFVFHEIGNSYAYKDPQKKSDMYDRIKQWELLNVDDTPEQPNFESNRVVEAVFPEELPLKVLENIFTVNSGELSETEGFNRLFFVHGHDSNSSYYEVLAVNTTDDAAPAKLQAIIDEDDGRQLFDELDNKDDLIEQIALDGSISLLENSEIENNVYLPEDRTTFPEEVLQTTPIPLVPIQNDLFPGNAVVSSSTISGHRRLATTDRRLDILDNETRLRYEYMIPNRANPSPMFEYELLTRSLSDVNNHVGWTNMFYLDSISSTMEEATYRMHFNGLPILSSDSDIEIMSIKYEQDSIQEYVRPLVTFERYPYDNTASDELVSGVEVREFLNETDQYDIEEIEGLKIGYQLKEQRPNLAYSLFPRWFIKISGSWSPLEMEEMSQNEEIS
ncbi:YycH family regulatory protein [Halobacillus sp. B29]|uniref:YycH family regulatory protein n=1 Tax=Halobacillus sp. B29 TaxID=3457432 RepID=UPI003FCE8A9A